MSHCVPDYDEFGADDGKAAIVAKRSLKAHLAYDCPNSGSDFSELVWTTDGNLVMQVGGNRSKNSQWISGLRSHEDSVAPTKPPERIKDGTLDSLVEPFGVTTTAATTSYPEEDDLISWLQYPDDPLEKDNCSDIFTQDHPQQQQPESAAVMMTTRVVGSGTGTGSGDAALGRVLQSQASTICNGIQWGNPPTQQSMLPPKPQKINSSSPPSPFNFSHFSRPAAIAKASLHTLGKCSTSITNHLQEQYKNSKSEVAAEAAASAPPPPPPPAPVEGSIGSAITPRSCVNQKDVQSSEIQGSQSSWPSLRSCTSRKEAGVEAAKDNNPSSSAAADGHEQTLTSSSGGSGTSAADRKRSVKAGKRKSKDVDDSTECQSEDVEGESVDVKKPPPTRTGSKRSRAAEVHNLSERRRRDRINEKMKALQELIPNSNKTDKASMLDEAIEYLKMLQLQLQMMSMRSGLSLPPMIIPAGMQHLQMPQLPPHLGMGMGVGMQLGMGIGMGMGMGVGLMERPVMQLPPLAGAAQTTSNASAMNMEMYHAYVLQQQIQHQQMQLRIQQQQQHQHQQQQQQHHQQQQQQQQHQHQQQKSSGVLQ